jgi:hypothetical protein
MQSLSGSFEPLVQGFIARLMYRPKRRGTAYVRRVKYAHLAEPSTQALLTTTQTTQPLDARTNQPTLSVVDHPTKSTATRVQATTHQSSSAMLLTASRSHQDLCRENARLGQGSTTQVWRTSPLLDQRLGVDCDMTLVTRPCTRALEQVDHLNSSG